MVARHDKHDPWTAAHKVYQYKQNKGCYHTIIYTIDHVCVCVSMWVCEWMNTVDLPLDLPACSFVSSSFLNSIGYSQQPADTFVSTQMHTWVHTHTHGHTHAADGCHSRATAKRAAICIRCWLIPLAWDRWGLPLCLTSVCHRISGCILSSVSSFVSIKSP